MSSPWFTGGFGGSDFSGRAASFSGRSNTLPSNMNNNNNNFQTTTTTTTTQNFQNPFYRTQQQQLPSIFLDPASQIAQNRSSNLMRQYLDPSSQIAQRQTSNPIGKRTLAEFQNQNINDLNNNNNNIALSNLLLRSVKPRNFQYGSPMSPLSPMDYSNSSTDFIDSSSSSSSSASIAMLLGTNPITQNCSNPITQNPLPMNSSFPQNTNFQYQSSNFAQVQNMSTTTNPDQEKKMMDHCLLELEKQLLEDSDDEGEQDSNSAITNNEWSETIQNLITYRQNPTQKPDSSSSTSSITSLNSSSSSIVSAVGSSRQLLMEAATAISEGKMGVASEILNHLAQTLIPVLNSDYRITGCMISALKSRVNHGKNPPPVVELFSKEHAESTQLLFDNSVCFKASFMAANITILEAAFNETIENNANINMKNLCVVDFDIGHGKRYASLLHELHARLKGSSATVTLKVTAVADNSDDERLKMVGDNLGRQAELLGIRFKFKVVTLKISELNRESLGCDSEDILAVNFAFKLFRMPDESVSTENPRDELLRRVKSLAPRVVTLLEQEMNTNTAPFIARVAESCSYYGALLDSIESTMGNGSLERVKIEEGLSRKLGNAVACEGRDRVERCEVFGKWRARMSMAGFKLNPVSQKVVESIKARLAPRSRVSVIEENGGVCFGWMGRTLTVASAWR